MENDETTAAASSNDETTSSNIVAENATTTTLESGSHTMETESKSDSTTTIAHTLVDKDLEQTMESDADDLIMDNSSTAQTTATITSDAITEEIETTTTSSIAEIAAAVGVSKNEQESVNEFASSKKEDESEISPSASSSSADPHSPSKPPQYMPPPPMDTVDDDDIAAKAAVTLAAVAAAATANHKSPAEAAREARMVAQSFIGGGGSNSSNSQAGGSGTNPAENEPIQVIPYSTVRLDVMQSLLHDESFQKDQLAKQASKHPQHSSASQNISPLYATILRTTPQGGPELQLATNTTNTMSAATTSPHANPFLLQHLLLLEHVRCRDESSTSSAANSTATSGPVLVDDEDDDDDDDDDADSSLQSPSPRDRQLAILAHDKLLALLKKVETAHDCLVETLPRKQLVTTMNKRLPQHPPQLSADSGSDEFLDADSDDDYETPIVVPDLLPPCTSSQGDATLAFFKACLGRTEMEEAAVTNAKPATAAAVETDSSTTSTTDSMTASLAAMGVEDDSHQRTDTLAGEAESSTNYNQESSSTISSPAAAATSFLGSLLKRGNIHSPSGTSNTMTTAASNASSSLSSLLKRTRNKSFTSGASNASVASGQDDHLNNSNSSIANNSVSYDAGDYPVRIEREMLGLTVENVLERTVVRTVLQGGPAKKAGAKVGSLIVRVGNVDTRNLTHFETIDELRQSQRPLNLVMRQISDASLRSAREEMGRLIKGAGFGTIMDAHYAQAAVGGGISAGNPRQLMEETNAASSNTTIEPVTEDGRPLIGADLRVDAYTNLLKRRFQEANSTVKMKSKKDEAIAHAGEKLVWILTLFVIGLEKEAARLEALAADEPGHEWKASSDDLMNPTVSPPASPRRHRTAGSSHTAKEYADAAKSVSKVLLDFTRKRLDPNLMSPQKSRAAGFLQHSLETVGTTRRRGNKGPPPPPSVGRKNDSTPHEKPLLQIGDVLQRTRTFLADTTSPPAALLRGELIAFLCDVLDIDTDMELAEEESATSIAGGNAAQAGMINDLGSAGSLLKIIILNCPIMRSPCCEVVTGQQQLDPETEKELRQRFGPRAAFSSADLHRLHAGNRFLSVVHRLAASRSTSARITACSLGPVLWGHLDFPHQLQLRGVITRALHDVEVIVRKSTASVLHEIAELVFDRRAVPWLVLMCERAMTDPEPQLRSAAMTLTWHLAEHLPNAFLGNASQGSRYLRRLPNRDDPIFSDVYLLQCKLLPVATRLAEDRSPSVRLAVAAQCDRLCDALGDHWSSVIIDVLLALLSDSDDRVRCEAVSCVPRLAEIVMLSVLPGESSASETSVLEALIPASIKLQKDSSASVRVALAAAAGELLTLLVGMQARVDSIATPPIYPDSASERGSVSDRPGGEDAPKKYKRHVDDRLIPLVQALLNDKDPEVTSAALRAVTNATRNSVQAHHHRRHMSVASVDDDISLSSYQSHQSDKQQPVFSPVLSEKQVLRLLPTLTELADSRQWRVRQSAVEIVPALLGCTQKLGTRSEISKLCVRLMSDQVDAVRKTAAECLCMGGSSLGSHGEDASAEWFTSIVIPTIRECAVHSHSKQRLLSLKMVEVMLLNGAFPAKWKGEDAERMADSPLRELAVIAMSLTGDQIANVRLNVGRVLEGVLQVFDDDDLSFLIEVLTQQIDAERNCDNDQDVLFFAQRCIYRARAILDEHTNSLARDDDSSTNPIDS